MTIFCLICGIAAAYLLGSVDFAIIVTKLCGKGDIRAYGSESAGMTNVLRTVGKKAAALTFLGDFSKGVLSVLMMRGLLLLVSGSGSFLIFGEFLAAYAALLGHTYPLYYHFKGGKGIAVSAGALLVLDPLSCALCVGVFLIVVLFTKYVSVGSIAVMVLYPFANLWTAVLRHSAFYREEALLAIPISLFIIFLHRKNIGRLKAGTESKITFQKKE